MKHSCLTLVSVFLMSLTVFSQGAGQQRPSSLYISYDTPPRSWKDAIARANLVAVVRLTKESPALVEMGLPHLQYESAVVEVVAGDRAAVTGRTVTILRLGGTREVGGRFRGVQEEGFPAWQIGSTLLVFLKWAEGYKGYVLPFGPDSVFERDPSTMKVRASGHGALAARQNGRLFEELLRDVRAQSTEALLIRAPRDRH